MDCIHCGGVNTASKQQTTHSTGAQAVSRMICLGGCRKATKWLPHVERGEQADAAWIAGEIEPMDEPT